MSWSYTTRLFQKVSGRLDPRKGRGLYDTFHARYPPFRYPLDHVFHSDHFTVVELKVLPYVGSDHFPIWTRLQYDPEQPARLRHVEADEVDHEQVDRELDRLREKGNVVVVTYDLIGKTGEEYAVDLLLSTSGGNAYDYEPTAVSGDVGDGLKPGTGKQIRWRVLEDFPDGLQHPNVQFKVVIEREGGTGWLYVLGGAVLAGGGGTAAAVLTGLIGGDSGSGDGDGSGDDTIPPLDPNPPD